MKINDPSSLFGYQIPRLKKVLTHDA